MIEYMKRHEHYIREVMAKNPEEESRKELLAYHDKQIQWMQHERMAHLVTMLFVCLFTLLSLGFAVMMTSLPSIALCLILIILTVAYIIHYYRLENGIQKWYLLADEIIRHNKP